MLFERKTYEKLDTIPMFLKKSAFESKLSLIKFLKGSKPAVHTSSEEFRSRKCILGFSFVSCPLSQNDKFLYVNKKYFFKNHAPKDIKIHTDNDVFAR